MSYSNTRTCFLCGHRKDRWECEPNPILKVPVCEECIEPREYGTKNTRRIGHLSKHTPPFSVEFEVAAPCFTLSSRLERALILVKYGFIRTQDDSVDDEYKSPIYQSLRSFYKPLGVMHTLRDLVTSWCGTHLHVTLRRKANLVPIQDEVFALLLAHMASNESETVAFWGRSLCKYANESSATRYACFSLWSQHDTLEYRLPRFRSAEQYLGVVRFCLQTTAYLDACLDPSTALKYPVSADQMAHHMLTFYRQSLVCPVPTLPLVTKGAFCHV